MTPTEKAHYNADEAKKELMATLHASRDLSPEMDDALADRYLDRLRELRPAGSYDPTRVRSDLTRLIQSARGSDPVGDDALAEDFLAHLKAPLPMAPPHATYPSVPQSELARLAPVVIAGAIVITAMIISEGRLWWLIFFMPMLIGWMGGNSRRRARIERYRHRYYRELERNDPNRPLPPPNNPPEIL